MDLSMFGDVAEEMSKANIIPEYNQNVFHVNNTKERTLLWRIEPRVNPDIFEYTLALMFFFFLYPVLERWFWSFMEMQSKITKDPVKRGESIYRDNPMRRQAVCIFIKYDEHLLYYSLSAGFFVKMRSRRNSSYERFYRRLRLHSKQRRITFSEDYS